jgi:tRNA pseudouridine55 synthase
MKKILNLYKPIGFTPVDLIKKLKNKFPEYKDTKIAFAGRLDPMAHGVLILMLDNAIKERNKYLGLTKQYEFEVFYGVSTDTYDQLGLVKNATDGKLNNSIITPAFLKNKIEIFLKNKTGKSLQAFPPYSSKEVHGKPLYQWARENKLSEISMPSKEIEIYEFELLSIEKIPAGIIKINILSNIEKVVGDFRQKEIVKQWNDFFRKMNKKDFLVAKFRLTCSSGTYVRGMVNEMGEEFGCGATALDILRTKVGGYELKKSLRIRDSKSKLKL